MLMKTAPELVARTSGATGCAKDHPCIRRQRVKVVRAASADTGPSSPNARRATVRFSRCGEPRARSRR